MFKIDILTATKLDTALPKKQQIMKVFFDYLVTNETSIIWYVNRKIFSKNFKNKLFLFSSPKNRKIFVRFWKTNCYGMIFCLLIRKRNFKKVAVFLFGTDTFHEMF